MDDHSQDKKYTDEDLRAARERGRYQAEIERINNTRGNIFGITFSAIVVAAAVYGTGLMLSGIAGLAIGWGLSSWYHASESKKLSKRRM